MTTQFTWYTADDFAPDQLKLLADACDHCPKYRPNGEIVLLWAVRSDGDTLTALYRCPKCGHRWFTSWGAEFVGVSLPTARPESLTALADRALRDLGWPGAHGGSAA